jgi:hypothetical protein
MMNRGMKRSGAREPSNFFVSLKFSESAVQMHEICAIDLTFMRNTFLMAIGMFVIGQ